MIPPFDYINAAPVEHLHRGSVWAMLMWFRTGDLEWHRAWGLMSYAAIRNATEAVRDERIRNAATALIGYAEESGDPDLIDAARALREALS